MLKAKRDETVRVRFTPEEVEAVRRKAKAEGVPVSTYLRRLALTVETEADAAQRAEETRRALDATLPEEDIEEMLAIIREGRRAHRR